MKTLEMVTLDIWKHRCQVYQAALEEIASPLEHIERRVAADPELRVNYRYAVLLCESASYLQGIARKALAEEV